MTSPDQPRPPELSEREKDELVRSVQSSMRLSRLEPGSHAEGRAMLEQVLREPPLVFDPPQAGEQEQP